MPEAVDPIVLPYPDRGVGGGQFVLSPSERTAILSLYSGQSEQGYEVFESVPRCDTRVIA